MSLLPISEVAASLGLASNDYEPYGWHKAKLAQDIEGRIPSALRGRYVFVTAVNPTPLGEGKTVVTIGLAMALSRLGYLAMPTLRQPSLAPVFGVKGGGAGGGRSCLVPTDEINLHFTGDIHAVAAANNLLAAMIDNHLKRNKLPTLSPSSVSWRRSIDMGDKALGHILAGLDDGLSGPRRETGFDLTAASEVMAILSLSDSVSDMRARLGAILVGLTDTGTAVRAEDLKAAGAMAALLRDAIRPNLVQTAEGTPAFVHAGPFANIAHGNSSTRADRIALRLADYVVTECGFGADCGGEKFIDIKCRTGKFTPGAGVVVCSVRALKWHSGRFGTKASPKILKSLAEEDVGAVQAGSVNLAAHLSILRQAGIPAVVAINRFPGDTDRELDAAADAARAEGAAEVERVDAFQSGGNGCLSLAQAVVRASREVAPLRFFYSLEATPYDKLEAIAKKVYGADGVELSESALASLTTAVRLGMGKAPICVAKTQYSLSHDPVQIGRPKGFRLPIRRIGMYAGAGFLYALAGDILTLPGLPPEPAAGSIDVDALGNITGLR